MEPKARDGSMRARLLSSLGGLTYNLVVYGGLILLGWAAAGGLRGFFNSPARVTLLALLVIQEAAAAWVRWRLPVPANPSQIQSSLENHGQGRPGKVTALPGSPVQQVSPQASWFDELTRERWRFLYQEMIYALAPFSDRQGIAVLPDSAWLRWAGLVLFTAAGAWMLWVMVARRKHLRQQADSLREPLLLVSGPYSRVRHPILLAVLVNSLAVALVFRSGGGLFLLILMAVTVFRRIRWMESDASRAVPLQWSAYLRHSWRLIPRVY